MSTTGNSVASEGMYSQLIDNEDRYEFSHRADVGRSVSPVRPVSRVSSHGPYRLATICLATLCAVLLISVIAVTAHYKNRPQEGVTPEQQKQDINGKALVATISKLQQEKIQLQKEKDELQAKLDAKAATKAPKVIKSTKAPPPPIVCPPNWYHFNNSCYFISRNSRDWPESQSYCQSQGGYLAIILTAEEQTFIWNLLPRGHWNAFWFGITDKETEDQWVWVDNTPLVGGFWEVGEPNNHINEDCGYIVKTRVLERVAIRSWYDAPCSMDCRFICEKEMGRGASTAIPH